MSVIRKVTVPLGKGEGARGRGGEAVGPVLCSLFPRLPVSERSEQGAGLGGGRGVELLLQQPLQLGELALRRLHLSRRPQQPDQILMALLSQRVGIQRAAGVIQGLGQVALRFHQADELGQGLQVGLRQPLPLQERPLLVTAGEQLAPIPFRRLGEAAELLLGAPGAGSVPQRGFEGGDVGGDRLGVGTDGRAVGDQHGARGGAGRLQMLAEEGEGDAQGSAPGGEVGVRPEELDEGVAGMGALGEVGQVGEQEPGLLAAEVGEGAPAPFPRFARVGTRLGSQGAQESDLPP
jgi:hypothetical protein